MYCNLIVYCYYAAGSSARDTCRELSILVNKRKTLRRIKLHDFAVGDIQKSLEKDMLIASCMLCVCFIDSVSGYYCGVDHFTIGKDGKKYYKVGDRYKQFCKDYLQKRIDERYTPELLYDELRNNLVHSYSATESFVLSKGFPENYHLGEYKPGSVLILADVFYSHVKKAFEYWVEDLSIHSHLRTKAIEWYHDHKIFQMEQMDFGF